DAVSATVVNGPLSKLPELGYSDAHAAAIIIDGKWPSSDKFTLRLEGPGTASVWLEAEGDLSIDNGGDAPFPAALHASPITSPTAAAGTPPTRPSLGAVVNRPAWTDTRAPPLPDPNSGAGRTPPLDSVAFFSSAGPTTDSRIKPDLVAPGAFVVGAMSRDANP